MAIALKTQKLRQQQRQRTAALLTILICGLTFALLYFVKIYFIDFPQNMDYGMEVTFGKDNKGSGSKSIPIESVSTTRQDQNDDPSKSEVENVENVKQSELSDVNVPSKKENNTKPNRERKKEQVDNTKKQTKSTEGTNTNTGQGNDKNEEGMKGKENGINKEGLYEGNGGKGGTSLSMSGWKWETPPKIDVNFSGEGTIIFSIEVDDEGTFITVKPVYPGTTITDQNIIEKCRQAVLKAYLAPDLAVNATPAPRSKGIVTIVFKSK